MPLPNHPDIAADLAIAEAAPAYHDWILDGFGAALKGDVLEVGAGVGVVSERLIARENVRSLLAVEPFASMHEALHRRLGEHAKARIFQGTLADLAEHERFDAVVYVNVLEHIDDDVAELMAIFERLKPGGAALIFVPACPMLMSDFDRRLGHQRRYRRVELQTKARAAGLLIERLHYFDIVGAPLWLLGMRLLRSTPSARAASWYDRLVVPLMRRVEAWITPPIGKNLLLIARKPL